MNCECGASPIKEKTGYYCPICGLEVCKNSYKLLESQPPRSDIFERFGGVYTPFGQLVKDKRENAAVNRRNKIYHYCISYISLNSYNLSSETKSELINYLQKKYKDKLSIKGLTANLNLELDFITNKITASQYQDRLNDLDYKIGVL